MEHNSGIETSDFDDNHADRRQCQEKSHNMRTGCHAEERGGVREVNFHLDVCALHLHDNKSA